MPTPAEAVDPFEPHAPPTRTSPSLMAGLVRVARPRQWLKNVLVFVAPGAAGVLLHPNVLAHSIGVFGIFCLAATGAYFLNDALDVEADRAHPTKRFRPIAAGVVPVGSAIGVGVGVVGASVALSFLLAGWHLALVMITYGVINIVYSLGLKNEPILDLVAVSSGFVLRAAAGGVATGVPLSNWFLIVASFGSLLVVTGKRSGEKQLLSDQGDDHAGIRQTLAIYTASFLLTVRTLAAAAAVTAYCLWAFERAAQVHPGHDPVWFQLTIVPFVVALLHVVRLLDSGQGAAPEDLALRDHRLQIYGVVWVTLFAIGIYS
ncbi:MAG: decaprenyl-phosphate phosphoribosyltransferase [Acidimicrobiales bacterium]